MRKTYRSGLGVLRDESELVAHEQREEGVATGQDVQDRAGDRGGGVEEASELEEGYGSYKNIIGN